MKRLLILFSVILLSKILCSSQTILTEIKQDSIVSITSEQLKYANLIFAEHEKLLSENQLLNTQIINYQNKINLANNLDSLRQEQITELNRNHELQIEELNNVIATNARTIKCLKIGLVTVGAGLIYLIFK